MAELSTNNALTKFIEEIKSGSFSDQDVEKWEQILKKLMEESEYNNERLQLSQITIAIYNITNSNQLDQVENNYARVMAKITQWDLSKGENVKEQLKKIEDHIQMAIAQRNFILNNVNELESKLYKKEYELDELRGKLEWEENEVKKLQDSKTRIYTEFVTILGIFTTIIFASFGGLSVLENVLSNISDVATEKLLVLSSLTIASIILLLFILLNGISKLTNLNLRSCGCNSNFRDCPHNIFQKHPTFVASLMITLYIFMLGGVGYFINYQEILNQVLQLPFHVILVVLLLLPLAMVYIFIRQRKKY